jgi:hypothetical protein
MILKLKKIYYKTKKYILFLFPDHQYDETCKQLEVRIPELICVINKKGRVKFITATANKLLGYEIDNKIPLSSPIIITKKETDAILKLTNPKYNCLIGAEIVAKARRDVGLIETGWDTIPGGTNMGGGFGFVARPLKKASSGKVIYEAGRIDEMIKTAGLNNEQQFNSKGKGYEWCACAVISWWKSVGLQTPPGGSLVANWVPWAVKNGLYSNKPVLGAAIIYKSGGSYIHIGIVSGIMPDGTIISIEGNASKQGFSARGICCREGVAWIRAIDGFVIPPGCQ